MNARKVLRVLGSFLFVGAVLTSIACKPTPEAACKSVGDMFERCHKAGDTPWGDKQMTKCVEETRAAGYEKSVKKCSELKDCESARTCVMIMLVGASKKDK
jgi:hypothetical protein